MKKTSKPKRPLVLTTADVRRRTGAALAEVKGGASGKDPAFQTLG